MFWSCDSDMYGHSGFVGLNVVQYTKLSLIVWHQKKKNDIRPGNILCTCARYAQVQHEESTVYPF